MVDKNNIYESGILERFLTGDVSTEEESYILKLLEEDGVLRKHVNDMEIGLEAMAQENAITPPSIVKELLLKKIDTPLTQSMQEKSKIPSYYIAIAATMILLLGSLAFLFYNETQSLQNTISDISDKNKVLENQVDRLEKVSMENETKLASLKDPQTRKYILKGNNSLPNAVAIAYLNTEKQLAYINTAGLPELPEDKDYQMWADVEGEMISMGVLPVVNETVQMQFIEDATSINITIEPKGGNDHATVANLVANYYITP